MMNFEEFIVWAEENITSGWRTTSKVDISVVKKNNGVSRLGLSIREDGQDSSPVLYLGDHYKCYLNGEKLENIIKNMRNAYDGEVRKRKGEILNMRDFEKIRKRIIYRLVNYEKNKELLRDCPYIRLHDLAVTFRWVAYIDELGVSTSLITNAEIKELHISVSDLILAARQNTPRLFPVEIIDMDDMLASNGIPLACPSATPMYILTNRQKINGASALLYKDVVKDFANEKGSDMYILPSSIHEVILVPADKIDDVSGLASIVCDANATVVSMDDVLSDSVYYYDRISDHIYTKA